MRGVFVVLLSFSWHCFADHAVVKGKTRPSVAQTTLTLATAVLERHGLKPQNLEILRSPWFSETHPTHSVAQIVLSAKSAWYGTANHRIFAIYFEDERGLKYECKLDRNLTTDIVKIADCTISSEDGGNYDFGSGEEGLGMNDASLTLKKRAEKGLRAFLRRRHAITPKNLALSWPESPDRWGLSTMVKYYEAYFDELRGDLTITHNCVVVLIPKWDYFALNNCKGKIAGPLL